MGEYRKVPISGYGKGNVASSFMPGIALVLIGWLLLFFGVSNFPKIIFIGIGFLKAFCLVLGAALILFGFTALGEGISSYKAQRSWFGSAHKAQTDIAQREEVDNNTDYARYYGEPFTYWYLKIKPIPEQLAVHPSTTLVSVSIKESQYKDYEGKSTVTIFYSPIDPFIFLLEDEV
jgi:hypothetical protein